MGNDLSDDWYIEHSGESRILDADKVASEIARLKSRIKELEDAAANIAKAALEDTTLDIVVATE